MHLDEE